ncbi:hypothetical protein V5O48_012282 [Marasmius crinis-equi]|uniref:COP9 signalosome complex subunit 3 N-terminal helical repeats domain-containing protein n=1 Tax=Marasmius crinis-equi TaxID=585013 RepID=A0ABR3F377_9AGAR
MESNNQNITDGLVQQITTTNNVSALNLTLRATSRADGREAALAGALSSGEDPLNLLDLRNDTLGVLYILSARLTVQSFEAQLPLPPPAWEIIENFCNQFIPEQARHAPERMTMLGSGIIHYAAHLLNPKWAIRPLLDLVMRYPPTPSTLTKLHSSLVLVSLQTGHVGPVAGFLVKHPIDDVLTSAHLPGHKNGESPTTDVDYTDNLLYQYMAGMALTLAALPLSSEINPSSDPSRPSTVPPPPANFRLLTHALSYFETCMTAPCASPNTPPSAIQFEALKKLRLLQCIRYGGPKALPKYTHPALSKLWKSSGSHFQSNVPTREERSSGGYAAFVNAFPGNIGSISNTSAASSAVIHPIRTLALRDRGLFEHDMNWGLVLRVVGEAESGRWQVKQLTESYVRLGLGEIGKALGWVRDSDPPELLRIGHDKVRSLLLQMIESKTINASISAEDIVTFHDNAPDAELDELLEEFGDPPAGLPAHTLSSVLAEIQNQTTQLQALEQEMSRSKRFLTQVVKNSGSGGGGGGYSGGFGGGGYMMGAGGPSWAEDDEASMAYGQDDSMYG